MIEAKKAEIWNTWPNKNNNNEDFYNKRYIHESCESGEISSAEEGFMVGFLSA